MFYSGRSLEDVRKKALYDAQRELSSMTDEEFLANSRDEIIEYLEDRYGVFPVTKEAEYRPVDLGNVIQIQLPVKAHRNNGQVLQLQLSPENSGDYELRRDMRYDDNESAIIAHCRRDAATIKATTGQMDGIIGRLNQYVSAYKPTLTAQLAHLVDTRSAEITDAKRKEEQFQQEVQALGITLYEKLGAVRPINVEEKREIKILRKPSPKKEEPDPFVDEESVTRIVRLINQAGRGFELAPLIYQRFGEEDLRTIIIGYLNAVFGYAAAQGEVFQKAGKADIHLTTPQGAVLIVECKEWEGQAAYPDAVLQLFSYMAIRQRTGIVATFSRNQGFTQAVDSAIAAVKDMPSLQGQVTIRSEGHFESTHVNPDDHNKSIVVHHLFFNLYTSATNRRGKRQTNKA